MSLFIYLFIFNVYSGAAEIIILIYGLCRPVSENVNDETLCLEVWDFDPAETVKEKIAKINQIKGVKGLRKLVKEIALTAATGQHENELIGKANIPLKVGSGSNLTYRINN